jgi:hypothetical protein
MDKNIVSSDIANDLLSKLMSERIPVHALLTLPSGSQAKIFGFVTECSVEKGFTISEDRPQSPASGFILIPLEGIHTEVSFGDEREALVPKFGNATLVIRFLESGEFLVLIFTL